MNVGLELHGYEPAPTGPLWAATPYPWPRVGQYPDEVAGGVLVGCERDEVVLLDPRTGAVRWHWMSPGPIAHLRGSETTAVAVEGGTIHVLDAATGLKRWTRDAPNALAVAGDSTVFVGSEQTLMAIDAMTGETL